MNNKMPEKIYLDPDPKRVNRSWCAVRKYNDDVSYTRTDTIPDVTELQRQNAVLKAFAKLMLDCSFEGADAGGDYIQEEAVKLAIIVPRIATAKDVEEMSYYDVELGDKVYSFAPWMTNDEAVIPSKIEEGLKE